MSQKIESISTVTLDEDSFLWVEVPDGVPGEHIRSLRQHLAKILGATRANRIIISSGDIKITKIQMGEALSRMAEKEFMK